MGGVSIMRTKLLLGALYCLLTASPCFAATVQPIQGTLYISRGQGWQPVSGPTEANVGEAVMVEPGGLAAIVYPDGCKFGVQPGAITTIRSTSPCLNPFTGKQDATASDPPDSALAVTGAALLGAAGLGVGIYALTQHNSNTTVSPMNCGTISNPCWESISP